MVGDWVALDDTGSIAAVVPRRTTISCRAAHEPASGVSREQVIAANVDIVLVVQALGQELDRRLLERYLALALESGARPVVVLTKADLEADPAGVAAAIADVGGEVPILTVSARTGLGLDGVRDAPRLGQDGRVARTVRRREVHARERADRRRRRASRPARSRADGAGRHTTTRRELVSCRAGASSSTTPACGRCISGSAREASRMRSKTSRSSQRRVGSPIAGTRRSRDVPSGRRCGRPAPEEAMEATTRSNARWPSSPNAWSAASARARAKAGHAVARDLPAAGGLEPFGENLDPCLGADQPRARARRPGSRQLGRARRSLTPLRSFGPRARPPRPRPPSRTGRIPSGRA